MTPTTVASLLILNDNAEFPLKFTDKGWEDIEFFGEMAYDALNGYIHCNAGSHGLFAIDVLNMTLIWGDAKVRLLV